MPSFFRTARLGLLTAAIAFAGPVLAADGPWQSLFNGKDLAGWTTWVSMQPTSDNMKTPTSIRGANSDPKKVFSVVDGMLRVSGEEWGAVNTVGEYGNFHLKFEFKWGEKKWFPGSTRRATAGCCTTRWDPRARRAATGCAATSSSCRRATAPTTTASMA